MVSCVFNSFTSFTAYVIGRYYMILLVWHCDISTNVYVNYMYVIYIYICKLNIHDCMKCVICFHFGFGANENADIWLPLLLILVCLQFIQQYRDVYQLVPMKVRVDRIIYYFLQKGFVVNDANKPSNKPTNQHASHTSLHNSTIFIPFNTKMSTCLCPLNLLKYCEKWSIHHFARLNICLSGGEKYLILER